MPTIRTFFLAVMCGLWAISGATAQDTSLIAPNIFLRGMSIAQGVRYSAAFVKPSDDTALRNVSVEITLPQEAVFLEMLISRQIEFDVIRRSPQKQLTLIWQISRVRADQLLDAFSFTVAKPLTAPLQFYMQWQDEDGLSHVENFFEHPTITDATQTEQTLTFTQSGFQSVGATGVQIAPPSAALPLTLNIHLLPNDFNPPPDYGDLWWCSLMALEGLPAGTSAQVIVPLRRPVAPFTSLALFQQQADGTWTPLETQAIVTADGQYVLYTHPGGLVASGGPEEIQQMPVTVEQAVIVDVPSIPEPAPVIAIEPPPAPTDIPQIPIEPTQIPVEPTQIPVQPIQIPVQPTLSNITDGSSNTIIIGEARRTPTLLPTLPAASPTSKTDGVITVGGITATPALLPTLSNITDGSSNTIIIGEVRRTPTLAPTSKIDGVVANLATPTRSTITDGSSNTIIIGEATRRPTPPLPATRPAAIATLTPLPTPTTVNLSPGVIVNPPPLNAPILPFGSGGIRVEIVAVSNKSMTQCSVGAINCAVVMRVPGKGAR